MCNHEDRNQLHLLVIERITSRHPRSTSVSFLALLFDHQSLGVPCTSEKKLLSSEQVQTHTQNTAWRVEHWVLWFLPAARCPYRQARVMEFARPMAIGPEGDGASCLYTWPLIGEGRRVTVRSADDFSCLLHFVSVNVFPQLIS